MPRLGDNPGWTLKKWGKRLDKILSFEDVEIV
jgi:hypothetical protein